MGHVFDIGAYGAQRDSETVSTAAIQRAIDACHEAGGGRVLCGAGHFLTGSLVLRSNVELHLSAGCKLVGSTCLDDYEDLVAPGFNAQNAPERRARHNSQPEASVRKLSRLGAVKTPPVAEITIGNSPACRIDSFIAPVSSARSASLLLIHGEREPSLYPDCTATRRKTRDYRLAGPYARSRRA